MSVRMSRSASESRSPSPPPRRAAPRSPSPDDAPISKRKRYVLSLSVMIFTHHHTRAVAQSTRSTSPSPRDRSPSPPLRRRRSISPPKGNGRPNGSTDAPPVESNGGNADAIARAEFAKLLGSRSGGAYMPPAKLRAMQAEAAKDKSSSQYQRLSWDALRKSINGLINKVGPSDLFSVP